MERERTDDAGGRRGAALGNLAGFAFAALVVAGLGMPVEAPPRPGDILPYDRDSEAFPGNVPDAAPVLVTAIRLPVGEVRVRCVLDAGAMAAGGGSVFVQRHDVRGETYDVHWIGARSSAAPGSDCGRDAELRVPADRMAVLARTSRARSAVPPDPIAVGGAYPMHPGQRAGFPATPPRHPGEPVGYAFQPFPAAPDGPGR